MFLIFKKKSIFIRSNGASKLFSDTLKNNAKYIKAGESTGRRLDDEFCA